MSTKKQLLPGHRVHWLSPGRSKMKKKINTSNQSVRLDDWLLPLHKRQKTMNALNKRVSLPGYGIIFIEGARVLAFSSLRSDSDVSIFLHIDKKKHYSRFVQHYLDKGLMMDMIERLYERWIRDEYPLVEESKRWANIIF
ncbi:MAG: hypothetical protein A4E53_00346 [Pelotomaculum sp. PtaB.Bin104]|nr:MAG: hypothetical protein A4E53_00346 [Pelotomaculum sp. PtaB.Bin104]